MSQLLTSEAIEQAGTLITKKGNTVVPGASTIGLTGGLNGVLITFDSTNSAVAIGDNTNNSYLMIFTGSGDQGIIDTNAAKLVGFSSASSAVSNINIANEATAGAGTTGPEISVVSTDSNVDLEIIPKGNGVLALYADTSTHSKGLAFGAGSLGGVQYKICGPQTGAQDVAGSIEFPTMASTGTQAAGQVLKISSISGTSDVVTEWGAAGGALTWTVNTTTTGTNTETPTSANVGIAFAGTTASGSRAVDLSSVASPSAGDRILVADSSGQASTYNIAVTGVTINGSSGYTIDSNYQVLEIAYINGTVGYTII